MEGYWAEIDEGKVVIYAEKYLVAQKHGLFQKLIQMRENYKKYQQEVRLPPVTRKILEMNGLEVIRDTFLALQGRWHWFTGHSRRDAFRLTAAAERKVSTNGFLVISIYKEITTEKDTGNYIEPSHRILKEAYNNAVAQERVIEDYTQEVGRRFRERGYLEPLEVFYFICWKSPVGAEIPNTWLFELVNKGEIIREITQEALKLAEQDKVKEAIEKLMTIPRGVRVRVASAILTFYNPEKFGAVDRFAWKALYGMDKSDFTPQDYIKYLTDIRRIAIKHGLKTREVDLALWELGKRG